MAVLCSLLGVAGLAPLAADASIRDGDATACFATARPVVAGEVITRQMVEAAPCAGDRARAALRFDGAHGLFIASDDLPAGSFLGMVSPAPSHSIPRGAKLYLTVGAGPVLIQREVIALEPARPGQRLFVQGEDGKPFAVTYVPAELGS